MITGKQFRDMIISGANNISNYKDEVDKLNVFPVPDGDTGVNMSMTIRASVRELERLPDNIAIEKVASIAASALLRGARGNSGVILSLLFRGFDRGMRGQETADTTCFVKSLQYGIEAAYNAIMKPTEGTILTVARVAVEQTIDEAAEMDFVSLLERIIAVQKETLAETPELLPVLKRAGVVDAGGMGLIIVFEGMLSVIRDNVIIEPSEQKPISSVENTGVYAKDIADDMTNEYCTEFLVMKNGRSDAIKLRHSLETIGNSVLCVDDTELIKCHVHTLEPNRALEVALEQGYLSDIKIENMYEQYLRLQNEKDAKEHNIIDTKEEFEYVAPGEEEYGFVAVSVGNGLHNLLIDIGIDKTVEGGQSMNPSTDDILAAVHSVAAQNVFVFTNNKNIILAAEQAVKLADRNIIVIPTLSVPQGISAMLAFDKTVSIEKNVITMKEVIEQVKSGSITYAVRDSNIDGKTIKEGEILGLIGGKIAFTDNSTYTAAIRLARRMIDKNTNFVTIIYGEGISETEANTVSEVILARTKHVEVSVVDGGQPIYSYLISTE
ncbi:MAG: DAK2 domain-containing protein [Oscillospiraceae bacterium]|nr:DAK2 domain-containing protein [Oscillospiraceae bacterium]